MKRIIISICLFFATLVSFSQIDNTMYFMDRLPQSSYLNAASYPDCKFYIGGLIIPLVGQIPPPITFALNTPIDYGDVIFKGTFEYSDSLITPLHPNFTNKEDFFKKLSNVNFTTFDLQISMLHFGFKQGRHNFWSFEWSERTNLQVGFPESLVRFPVEGNGIMREADFSGLHVNLSQYRQFAFGYKREISESFSIGGRLKVLTGLANIHTSSSEIILNTEEYTNAISATSDYVVNANGPLEVTLDSTGFVENVTIDDNFDIVKQTVLTGNYGIAIDFGVTKDFKNGLSLSASIEDFGYIRWKSDPHNFSLVGDESNDGGISFEGVDMTDLGFASTLGINDSTESNSNFDPDSIKNYFDFKYSQNAYTQVLPSKLYLGVKYNINEKITIGAVGRLEKLTYGLRPSATASVNFKPWKRGQFTISYSYINKNLNNIGFGIALPAGPIQWYFVTDNIIGLALFPTNTRSVSLRMGCNLVFNDKGKKDNKSKPLFDPNRNTYKATSFNKK